MSDETKDPLKDFEHPVNPHTGRPVPPDPPMAAPPPPDASRELGAPPVASEPASAAAPAGDPSSAPSQQELAIRSALETVVDPEIGLSAIDLGLIREVHVEPARTFVRMMLTTPFCPYAPQMIEDVKQASRSVVDQETEVEIMPDAWSPDMMPDPGLLGFSY